MEEGQEIEIDAESTEEPEEFSGGGNYCIATARLVSLSHYSASKFYEVPHEEKEAHDDYEKRTWRERCNYDLDTRKVFIPAMAFKKSLDAAASFLSEKIKGKRNATYTKHFKAGVLVTESLVLPITMNKVDGEWLFVPSDGKAGGGSRVKKCFPYVKSWSGEVTYHILDSTITQPVFQHTLVEAGNFIGVGRFRPERGGFYGRYPVESLTWLKK